MVQNSSAPPAATMITRKFLRRRFWIFGVLLLLPVTIAASISIVSLNDGLKSNNFSAAFTRLSDSITQLALSIRIDQDHHDETRMLVGHEAFVNLLGVYSALRASEATMNPPADAEIQSLRVYLKELEHQYGVDPVLQAERLGLGTLTMPTTLEMLWDGQSIDPHSSLDVQIGMVLKLAAPAFIEDADKQAIIEAARHVQTLVESRLSTRLAELHMALYKQTSDSAILPIYLVAAIFLTVTACFLISTFMVFRPLENSVLGSQFALVIERENAQAAERTKSEFLATMSHEIRTPLNGVLGMAELLEGSKLDERQHMYAQIIVRSGRTLLGVINDILDFSKIDAGYLKIETKPFKLSDVTYEPIHLVAPLADGKGLELALRIDPKLPGLLVGDLGRLRQVVTNLVGNAIKFTSSGQVMVNVSGVVTRGGDDGYMADLRFEVSDTGMGIPEEDLHGIFDKFTQIDSSSTRTHEGTGLGLSIVKGLVELMDGRIGIDSTLGRGTTVWFELSLPVAEDTKTQPQQVIDVAGSRILVIDDNETNRCILQEMLSAWRIQESSAASGKEGLRRLKTAAQNGQPYNLIILDHHMPGMNGEEVLRELRADPILAKTPVILLTSIEGLGSSAGRSDTLDVEAYLVKPTPASQLFDTIATLLAHRAAGSRPQPDEHATHPAPPAAARISGQAEGEMDDLSGADRERKYGGALIGIGSATGDAMTSNSLRAGADAKGQAHTVAEPPSQPREGGSEISGSGKMGPPGGVYSGNSLEETVDVLLVEDNEVNRLVVQHILMSLDLSCEFAENGTIGVEKFALQRPGLVLMDVSMPGMNGYEATAKIRAAEAAQGLTRTPIIGLTAHALQGDREKCLEAGMDDYLSKPVAAEALKEKIIALRGSPPERHGQERHGNAA